MAKGAFPETHELLLRLARHARPQVVELGAEQVPTCVVAVGARFDDRVTGKLSAFAPGRDRRPPRHRRGGDRQASPRGRAGRRAAEGGARASWRATLRRAAARRARPTPWLAQIAAWREEFPLRYGNGGDMLKPQPVLETLQALTAGRDDVDLDDRRRPAPDVGDAVPRSATRRARSSPRAGSGRWATASRPRSARRPHGRTRRWSAWTATAASR